MTQLGGDVDGDDDENDYFIPLEDQRVFGAGIKRKGIAFVSATDTNNDSISQQQARAKANPGLGDRYLAIVLGKNQSLATSTDNPNQDSSHEKDITTTKKEVKILCEICKEPIQTSQELGASKITHESSITHQVCLAHSHPPSHLDRDHIGLKYLSGYGWDPDARTGLGARREGIRAPIKAKEKRDTAGLGIDTADDDDEINTTVTKKKIPSRKEGKITKVDAGAVRKLETEKKKRAEKLRQTFYADDLSKYLGPDG